MRATPSRSRGWMILSAVFFCSVFATVAAHAAPVVRTVDSAGDVGGYTSLQLNSGNPVISYFDNANGDLKLATCTAGCWGATPTWIITTVDRAGTVGWHSSLQLNAGNPVIAYYHADQKSLKLATCTGGCATAAPTWVITTVDDSSAEVGRFASLQLNDGNPVISYRDRPNGDLKLATCTAGCATANPTWIIIIVDGAGDVGRFGALQLDNGRPVVAYVDFGNGTLKVATCLQGCATAAPTWVMSVVDTVPGDVETQLSLQLNGGRPVVSYYAPATKDLKLATCAAACTTATPTWVITTIDDGGGEFTNLMRRGGDAGMWSSLQLNAGNPVVAYYGQTSSCTLIAPSNSPCHTAADARLATCTAACATTTPTWVITTLDNSGLAGSELSLQLDGGRAAVSYYDVGRGHLRLAFTDLATASIPSNYTALWWNFDESGWGINFSHQGDIVFGTLFTYDAAGNPLWLVMSGGVKQPDGAFSGELYRTTGPPFDANPFTPIGPSNYTQVGTMSVIFFGDTASLTFTVDGVVVNKTIRKLVFGAAAPTCRPTTSGRGALVNYQDLWWNAAESGWGINLTHQGDIIFATLFTYGADGRGLWLVASGATKQADGSYLGDLYRTRGPAFNATPFTPIGPANYTNVGTMRFRFSSGESGTLTYTVNGLTVVKTISRLAFSSPVPACSE